MILVDTGYLLALASERDQHHARAVAWARRCSKLQPLVTEFVLVETLNGMSATHLRQRALDIYDAVMRAEQFLFVPSSRAILDAGMGLYRSRSDKAWSLTGCTSFHVMRQYGVDAALTYDRHFEQAGFDALLRREPD